PAATCATWHRPWVSPSVTVVAAPTLGGPLARPCPAVHGKPDSAAMPSITAGATGRETGTSPRRGTGRSLQAERRRARLPRARDRRAAWSGRASGPSAGAQHRIVGGGGPPVPVGGGHGPGGGDLDLPLGRVENGRHVLRREEQLRYRRAGQVRLQVSRVVPHHQQGAARGDRGGEAAEERLAPPRREVHVLGVDQVEAPLRRGPHGQVLLPPPDPPGDLRAEAFGLPLTPPQGGGREVHRGDPPAPLGQP